MTGTDVVDATGDRGQDASGAGASASASGASGAAASGGGAGGAAATAGGAPGSGAAGDGVGTGLLEKPRWRDRMSTTLEVIRANPTGRVALKIAVALAGLLVVAVGALLIPLPGPGWLIVLGGLGIWAIEFSWAQRLLSFTRRHLLAWTRWVTRQSWTVRIALGLVGMIFVSVVVWASVWLSFDVNLVTELLDYL
jgi:uncharacterized protein (TIGR02611 family)